jgi:hypothetical protein
MENVETSIEEMKAQILSALEATDSDDLVRKVWAIVKEQRKKDRIVGYEVDGTPVDMIQFEKDVAIATEEVMNGISFSAEEVVEQIKSWK